MVCIEEHGFVFVLVVGLRRGLYTVMALGRDLFACAGLFNHFGVVRRGSEF